MEYYREYIQNQFKQNQFKTNESEIKIIINKNKTNPFILSEGNELNSQSLFNLIDLHKLKDTELNLSDNNLKSLRQHLLNTSFILKENIIFFKFDIFNNFLLSNNSTKKDIQYILNKIKKNQIEKIRDYSLKVNPYKIERVVFSGGGSKGMIYLGVMLGLYSSGSIFYLNHFSGTSIGALTATLLSLITPSIEIYDTIKTKPLKDISSDKILSDRYMKCINFIIERFISRPIDTFYKSPKFTISSVYETVKKILYQNYLYDFENSGFGIWYALMCKYICKVMNNNLDNLILIKDKENKFIHFEEIENINFDSNFEGWKIERFFTFEEYNKITGKSIVLTGTKWDPIETVYYSKEDYPDTSIIKACNASSCLPGVFKPVIINDTNNLDGGFFDNYPLTNGDKKINNRVVEYNNKTVGFLIDDQNSIIEPYEIIRELWILYNGFINNTAIIYLIESDKYTHICEIFFEIRLILFKLLYAPNTELKQLLEHMNEYSKNDLTKIESKLKISELIEIIKNLNNEDIMIGKKTDLDDIFNIIFIHGYYYNIIKNIVESELEKINELQNKIEDPLIEKYKEILLKLKYILSYYELKGIFYKHKNIENMSENFIELIIELKKFISLLNDLSEEETLKLNKKNKTNTKNYIKNMIDISNTTLQKILTKITKNNKNISDKKKETYYNRIINTIYNSNISDIIYKYICVVNDKICTDTMNTMRTVKLNTFETNTLHFEIDLGLISRLIYDGYSKTIKHFVSIIYLMEITGLDKTNDDYLESYEIKYKKQFNLV